MKINFKNLTFKPVFAGLILMLLAVILNPWTVGQYVSGDGNLSAFNKFLVWLFDAALASLALAVGIIRKREHFFNCLLGLFLILVGVFGALAGLEIYLRVVSLPKVNREVAFSHVFYEKYLDYYLPFKEQELHPFYYVFFTQNSERLAQINSSVVSIDARGFRGALPEEAGRKKLAFIIGGSVVFGYGSTSNDATISAHLNKLQNKYHFVNAGVPAFNSTQEFYRLAMEIVRYKPDLIVIFDGFNDAASGYHQFYSGLNYPSAAPWFYENLMELAASRETNEGGRSRFLPKTNFNFFRRLNDFLNKKLKVGNELPPIVLESRFFTETDLKQSAQSAARAYLQNLELMKRLAQSYNVKILFFYQPAFFYHQNISGESKKLLRQNFRRSLVDYTNRFYEQVLAGRRDLGIIDFSSIFDKYFIDVPLGDIFLDHVHVFNNGNEIIAKEITTFLP